MMAPIQTPRCDDCDRPALIQINDLFLCERCDQRLNGAVETGAAPGLRSPDAAGCRIAVEAVPQPNVISFEDEVSALETQWARDGNILDILNSDGAIGLRGAR